MLQPVCTLLAILLFSVTIVAQRPGPQFWRKVGCEPLEPRTKLESFEEIYGAVIFKGFTRISTLDVRDVRIDAVEVRDLVTSNRARGVVISLRGPGEQPLEARAFIDYEEIDAAVSGIEAVSRVNETMTRLAGFEGRFRTAGDLEIKAFRQTRSGTAVTISAGICEEVTVPLTLDDLVKVKAMVVEAKAKLDEVK